jgi:hypothetical protein
MRRTLIRSQAETSDDEAIAAHQQWSRRPRERWELLREACEQATLGSRLSALYLRMSLLWARHERSDLTWNGTSAKPSARGDSGGVVHALHKCQ